jgi:lipid II:glycine glycyltransferase (peptidoglycan interpeptide bridge formation enzyme)
METDKNLSIEMLDSNPEDWNDFISALPGRHVLQTREWGEVKKNNDWEPMRKIWRNSSGKLVAAAQILLRSVSFRGMKIPVRVMYVPRGPLLWDWYDKKLREIVLNDLLSLGKEKKAIFVKIDPEVEYGRGDPGSEGQTSNPKTERLVNELTTAGWIISPEQVQFKNTVSLDLRPSLDELLSNMKQKSRYNVRLATRKGVSVRRGTFDDLKFLYQMYAETSLRDGFTIRNEQYYLTLWQKFMEAQMAEPLIAEVEGDPVAAVLIFRFAGRAWYMFGMSRQDHREKMPNHLLQWEAIRRSKDVGCIEYDLWGAPDQFVETDELWGVYRFKIGLGGEVVRYIGAWDLPVYNLLYRSYTQMMPRLLARMRMRGIEQTHGSLQPG